jgi:hypothetical protein
MIKQALIMSFLIVALILSAAPAFADDQEVTYGSQLMTDQEKIEFREKLRNAKTDEERDQLLKEHHEQMIERATEKGLTLPEEPLQKGAGMGHGSGMGSGGGMGSGSGSGGGKGHGGNCPR